MSKKDKLLIRFLAKPRDFTYDELVRLLGSYGYRETQKGRTSGSRVAFVNKKSGHIIMFHKPHPRPILKSYQLNYIEEELRKEEFIK